MSFISYHKTDILDKPTKMIIIVPFVWNVSLTDRYYLRFTLSLIMSNIIRNEIVGVNMKLIMSWIELCSIYRFSPRDVCCTVHWSRLMLLTIHWASVPRQTVISPSMSVCLSVFSTLWGWESTIPTPFISHKKIRQFRKSVFCLIRSF